MDRRKFLQYSLCGTIASTFPFDTFAATSTDLIPNTPLKKHVRGLSKNIQKEMKALNVPGISIVLIRDAKPVWNGTFGVMDIESKNPITTNTVFEAASLTKPVFAEAVLKLHEEGTFNLDRPLHEIIPEPFTSESPDLFEKITARHVLTHSTGFPNWRTGTNDPTINFTPGEKFSYSGEGFMYLQQVIEKLVGTPLDIFIKKRVFDPLGMSGAGLVWQDSFEEKLASGYTRRPRKGTHRKMTKPMAAASLVCSPADYAKFLCALLNPGTGNSPLCCAAMLDEMFAPAIPVAENISWGLGIGLQQAAEGKSIWHWGNNGNKYNAFFVGYPDHGLGAVAFTNSGNGLKLCQSIIPQAVGGYHPALHWPMVVS